MGSTINKREILVISRSSRSVGSAVKPGHQRLDGSIHHSDHAFIEFRTYVEGPCMLHQECLKIVAL